MIALPGPKPAQPSQWRAHSDAGFDQELGAEGSERVECAETSDVLEMCAGASRRVVEEETSRGKHKVQDGQVSSNQHGP